MKPTREMKVLDLVRELLECNQTVGNVPIRVNSQRKILVRFDMETGVDGHPFGIQDCVVIETEN